MNLTRLLYIPRAPDEIFQSVRKDDNDYLRKMRSRISSPRHADQGAARCLVFPTDAKHGSCMDVPAGLFAPRRARAYQIRLRLVSYQTVSLPVARLCLFPARSMHPFYLAMHCELCAPRAAITPPPPPPPSRFHFVGTRSAEKMSPHEKE